MLQRDSAASHAARTVASRDRNDRAFFDFFYEHCSLYTANALRNLLHELGFQSIIVQPTFNGQYLSAVATFSKRLSLLSPARLPVPSVFKQELNEQHTNRFQEALENARSHLHSLLADGPVVIWGAGAKGISFLNHLGVAHDELPYVVDINPAKQDRFVAVSAQRVIAPTDITSMLEAKSGVAPSIVVMNPNYVDEISLMIRDLGINGRVEVVDGGGSLAIRR